MMPIKSGQTLEIPDPKTGINYQFRYLSEDDFLIRFNAIEQKEEEIRELLIKETPRNENEQDAEYEKRLIQKLVQYRKSHKKETILLFNEYIDLFLCGWSSEKIKLPDFPKDGKPSQRFSYIDKMEMYAIIQDHIVELAYIKGEDIKN
jgi:hypothetical protein